jgi:hypothetical protein
MSIRPVAPALCAILVSALSTAAFAQQPVEYRVLATNRTSTMQKEMQAAGDQGYEYAGQTVVKTEFGGEEVVCILERKEGAPLVRYEW